MNKPIRRVAFVAMIMFGLLLANGTYMMIVRQSALAAEPQNRRVRDAEFAQDRGAILAAGQTEIASTEPSDDNFKFQRVYPEGELYAPITGFYSYDHARTALEATYNTQLAGTDDALFVRRLIDMATGRAPQGASVQTTIVPKVQQAAAEALGDQKGAVVALDPQTGAVLAMVTSPSYDPNDIASHDIDEADDAYNQLANDPDAAAGQPGGPRGLPAGVDVQAGHRIGRVGRRQDPREQGRLAGSAQAARHQRLPGQLRAPAADGRSPSPRRCGCPATPPSPTSGWKSVRTSSGSSRRSSASTSGTCLTWVARPAGSRTRSTTPSWP